MKSTRVGILGLAFKEDVPDLRNSRVPDIVAELRSFGIEALVHDPLADPATRVARPPALQRAVDDHVDRRLRGPGEDQLLAGARAYPPRVRGERGHRGGRQPTERAGAQRVEAARLVRSDRPLGEALAQPAPALADVHLQEGVVGVAVAGSQQAEDGGVADAVVRQVLLHQQDLVGVGRVGHRDGYDDPRGDAQGAQGRGLVHGR